MFTPKDMKKGQGGMQTQASSSSHSFKGCGSALQALCWQGLGSPHISLSFEDNKLPANDLLQVLLLASQGSERLSPMGN
jgi:hypothetical protein